MPEAVIASRPTDNDHRKHVFLVKWENYTHDENTWESYEHVLEVAPKLLAGYYDKHLKIEKYKEWKNPDQKARKRRR
jgi:hypothetical protein